MRSTGIALLLFCLTGSGFGQQNRKLSLYATTQYTHTLYDATKGNNSWGWGLGSMLLINRQASVSPSIELTIDGYIANDKVYRLYPDNTPIPAVGSMTNLFAGLHFRITESIYASAAAGGSMINGHLRLAVKPSAGVFLSRSKKWTFRIAYINIFNRETRWEKDFGAVSYGLGLRLF